MDLDHGANWPPYQSDEGPLAGPLQIVRLFRGINPAAGVYTVEAIAGSL